MTGVSEWSLTSSAGQWTIDWQVGGQANSATCTLLVAADGTASSVRSRLEIDVEKHRYQFPIAVLYGRQLGVSSRAYVGCSPDPGANGVAYSAGRWGNESGFSHIGRGARFLEARERKGASPSTGTVVPWRCFRFTALWRGLPARRAAKQAVPGEGGGGAAWRRAARDAPSARSMGMNTCFRVADQLAIALSALNPGFSTGTGFTCSGRI